MTDYGQLQPPPTQPLYLVALRSIHIYLRELSDIQDLGLNDSSGNGIITVLSEAIHWKQGLNPNRDREYEPRRWQPRPGEEWIDYQQYVPSNHFFSLANLMSN